MIEQPYQIIQQLTTAVIERGHGAGPQQQLRSLLISFAFLHRFDLYTCSLIAVRNPICALASANPPWVALPFNVLKCSLRITWQAAFHKDKMSSHVYNLIDMLIANGTLRCTIATRCTGP